MGTSKWEKGRLENYIDRTLIFDADSSTTVQALKAMIAAKVGIPAKRQVLTAHLRRSLKEIGDYVKLDDDLKTLGDFEFQQFGVCIKIQKNPFDENGDFVFDDAYFDDVGYHPPPAESWIPIDSIASRNRPDAQKTDPSQPLSIISDRAKARNFDEL